MQTNKDQLCRRLLHWAPCVLFVVSLAVVCFTPWFVDGKVLAPLDITTEMLLPWRGDRNHPNVHNHFVVDAVGHYLPYRLLAQQSFREDGYVGWNPLLFGGTAQYANTMLINYDWSVLLHRLVPFWTAWTGGRLGQILLAGLGMLLFLASRGYARGPATLGATAYMLNHQFVAWIYFNQVVAAFCWVPFMLWAIYAALEKSSRYISLAAIFVALALLGSTLQQAAFVAAVFGCAWLGALIDHSVTGQKALKITVCFAVAGALGAALVASMLEPTVHSFFENARSGHGRGELAYDAGLLQPLLHTIAQPLTLFPSVMGSASTLDLWKIFKLELFTVGFFGTVPMVIACVALFDKTVPAGAKLLIVVGTLVPLTPLVGFLYHRFNVVWILGGCWACTAWLDCASPDAIKGLTRWLWRVTIFAVLLWLVASVAIAAFREPLELMLQSKIEVMSSSSAFGVFGDWMQARGVSFLDYVCIWNPWQLLMLCGAVVSIWGLTISRSNRSLLQLTLAAGVALQLSVFWWQWTTWKTPKLAYNEPELVAVLRKEVGNNGRLAMNSSTWAETQFPPNMLMPAGVAITGGYDAIHPYGMKSPTGMPWDFPGVTHFLGKVGENGPEDWSQIWTDGRWQLLCSPRQSVGILSTAHGDMPLCLEKFDRPTLNSMEATVPAGTKKLTLFSNWHRDWRWRKNNQAEWMPVGRSSSRSIEVSFDPVPSADTRVFFLFRPSAARWAEAITLIGAVTAAAIGVIQIKRRA